MPAALLKKSNLLSNWFFGASSTFDKEILKTILKETDSTFLVWAIDKVVRWTNQTELKNVKHIHGTADRILPIRFIKCDFKVKRQILLRTKTFMFCCTFPSWFTNTSVALLFCQAD